MPGRMSADNLSATNRGLRLQAEGLHQILASLESRNRELLEERRSSEEEQKVLQATADQLKKTTEHPHKSLEGVTRRLDHTSAQIRQQKLQKKYLVKHNEELSEEAHEATGQLASFRAGEELRSLEEGLAEAEQDYRLEKSCSSQLRGKVDALQGLREARHSQVQDLQEQQEICLQEAVLLRPAQENRRPEGLLLPEMAEVKLRRVAGNRSKASKVPERLWLTAKTLFVLLFGCFPVLVLVLAYARFCAPCFIAETLLVVLSHQRVERPAYTFSPYLEFRGDGLLPF